MSAPGLEPKEFPLEHAERILALDRLHRRETWTVTDENYTVVDGKIRPGDRTAESDGSEEPERDS